MPKELAKFKRTKLGSTFKEQKKNVQSIKTGRASGRLSRLASIENQKKNAEEQMFLENLKLGLNQGKMNEVSYYNELVSHYEKKLSGTKNKLERVKLMNRIYSYKNAAVDAANAASGRATSTANKADRTKYNEKVAELNDLYSDVQSKLNHGEYDNASQYTADMNMLRDEERGLRQLVVGSESFTESSRRTNATWLDNDSEGYEDPHNTGTYGGLGWQTKNADNMVFVQSGEGDIPGKIDIKLKSTIGVNHIEGEDGILRKTRYIGEIDQQTDELVVRNPAGGEDIRYNSTDPEYFKIKGRRVVDIYDPFDPMNKVTWIAPLEDGGQWEGIGQFKGIKVDTPTFNPLVDVIEKGADVNLATTPFLPGTPAFDDLSRRGPQALIQDRLKPVEVDDGLDLADTQFKKPELRKKTRSDGTFGFFEGDKRISTKEYANKVGKTEDQVLVGEEDPSPLKKIGAAQEEAGKGFNQFKNLYNRYIKRK